MKLLMAKRKKKMTTFEYIIVFIIVAFTIYNSFKEEKSVFEPVSDELEVYFLDVGQADSILIRSQGQNVLIDAGNNADGTKIVEYLQELGIDDFAYVIGTHAHEDHIGGMDDIIDNFKIGTFYMPDVVTTTKTFEDVLDSLERKNLYFDTPKIGEKFTVGEGTYEILYVGNDENDLNATSIVIRLDHGENSFLFTGDATQEVENSIIGRRIDVDVLKVAHHGSSTSSTTTFLKTVKPKYAVIEVGSGNTYGHPSSNILSRLENLGAKIYRTDRDGTIIFGSDGENLDIRTIRTDTNG